MKRKEKKTRPVCHLLAPHMLGPAPPVFCLFTSLPAVLLLLRLLLLLVPLPLAPRVHPFPLPPRPPLGRQGRPATSRPRGRRRPLRLVHGGARVDGGGQVNEADDGGAQVEVQGGRGWGPLAVGYVREKKGEG